MISWKSQRLQALLAATLWLPGGTSAIATEPSAKIPIALTWRADGALLVGLRDSREVIAIDAETWSTSETVSLPFRPSCVIPIPGTKAVLVGGMNGELLRLETNASRTLRDAQGRGPVQGVVLDSERAVVASCWSRTVELIDLATGLVRKAFPISFSAGRVLKGPNGRILILDAFGSKVACLDLQTGRLRTRVLDGINLHAAAISGDRRELLVGHMSQYRESPVTSTNIDWGLVISSGLSAIRLTEFDGGDETEGKVLARRKITLDGSAHGASDPAAMAVSGDGSTVLIALSGAHQLLKNDRTLGSTSTGDSEGLLPLGHNQKLETLEVGQSPVDLILDPSSKIVITADAMSDTLTVVRVSDLEVIKTVHLSSDKDRPTQLQRGEATFMDGRRSLDRWMSCATCHARGHTNGLNFDTLGDGAYGAPKNTPSLLGAGSTAPYSWIGQFADLHGQVQHSLKNSLRGPLTEDSEVDDLTLYLQSLEFPRPLRDFNDPAAIRGSKVFENRKCASCHEDKNFTSNRVVNVGVDDGPGGHKAFNPPTLRGANWSPPYLHDGRAATLDAALQIHPPSKHKPPTSEERNDLKAYLESL